MGSVLSGKPARGGRSLSILRRAARGLVLLPLLFPSACGYSLQGNAGSRFADPGIRVDLRPFTNESLVPDGGAYIAARLREEMLRSGFRGRFERSMADYIIEGNLQRVRLDVVSRGEENYALEYRMTIFVDIRVVEVVRGRLLWKEDGLTDSASYYSGPDFQYTQSNYRVAFEEISRRLARRISQSLGEIL